MTLSPSERRREIVNLVMARKTVALDDLAEHLGVSRMTVHRDLDLLEERGLLRKERGGATAESSREAEAIPLIRCIKFKAGRSALRILKVLP